MPPLVAPATIFVSYNGLVLLSLFDLGGELDFLFLKDKLEVKYFSLPVRRPPFVLFNLSVPVGFI